MKPRKSLTFGIDIDGTVTDPGSIVPLMNEAFGKNLSLHDYYDYNLATVYGIADEEFVDWLKNHGHRLYSDAPVHGQADIILRNWFATHELIYISAREEKDRAVTLDWFTRYDIPFHNIDLIGSHNKLEAAKKWSVDLFIEDRLENALQLSEELTIPVFLFDTPYNQAKLPSLIQRVHSWEEIHTKISLLFQTT